MQVIRDENGRFVRGTHQPYGFKKNHNPWNKDKEWLEMRGDNNPSKRLEVRVKIKKNRSGIPSKLRGTKNPKHSKEIKDLWRTNPNIFLENRHPIKKFVTKTCIGCGKEFTVRTYKKNQKYCRVGCYLVGNNYLKGKEPINKFKINKSTLNKLYFDDGLTQSEIAKLYHVTRATVLHRMKKLGINISKEEKLKRLLSSRWKRPTSLEKQFNDWFIIHYNTPYKYVGNGKFNIENKNPDFVNVNGEKICVEVRPSHMCHIWNGCSPEEYAQQRREHFAKYGWKCLVFFARQIHGTKWKFEKSNEEILKELLEFGVKINE